MFKKIISLIMALAFAVNLHAIVGYGVSEEQGFRPTMEDTYTIHEEGYDKVYVVFDGHGGSEVSKFASEKLHLYILKNKNFFSNNIVMAIKEGFAKTDNEMKDANLLGGSCAITALINENEKEKKLYVANIGDCRAVLSRDGKVVALSRDHKASDKKEKERVKKAGGEVKEGRVIEHLPNDMVRRLAVSRAFGDFSRKDKGIISEPEIFVHNLDEKDEFLILASDGVWDVLSNESAVNIVRNALLERKDLNFASNELLFKALFSDSKDNITVMIIQFKDAFEDRVEHYCAMVDEEIKLPLSGKRKFAMSKKEKEE